ncbi:MAG: asparagine--tRNA ligase [Flavobacteriales bacterium]|nr:asparagine--tRNA ligase [Flavobacteriales bacterium]|tara:strand:- start:1340 stop:2770 length:1431 start_codon:yes stop_codon:yes gene_type:complete
MYIKDIFNLKARNQQVTVYGWIRTKRGSKNVSFISLNDGSTLKNLQVVVENKNIKDSVLKQITTGASIEIIGTLVKSSGSEQNVEINAAEVNILGASNPDEYPLQPKKHSLDFLRENAHLRFRTNTFSSVFRIRHSLTFAIHSFFNENGFYNIHTPIITSSDAEGAGEMFQVTNFDLNNIPKTENKIDYVADFFGKKTHLTVSGQLEAELAALGLGKVYTFGPTFRAENSNTSRHLSEFWMIEPEMAFYNLEQNINLAEKLLKYCIEYCIEKNYEDLTFLDKRLLEEESGLKKELRSEMSLLERLDFVVTNSFERITYSEAINILIKSKPNKKKKFQYLISGFGADLQSEHEKFLVEKVYKKPVVITDYPKENKAFYMRSNKDGKTVRAMDILFPTIGEIIGGSQREERLDKLLIRMSEMKISKRELWWYLDTRKFGTCIHSGFGLGFERLMMFITGMKNIRDVIPFPRTPQNALF